MGRPECFVNHSEGQRPTLNAQCPMHEGTSPKVSRPKRLFGSLSGIHDAYHCNRM